jgi:hypothetical protein
MTIFIGLPACLLAQKSLSVQVQQLFHLGFGKIRIYLTAFMFGNASTNWCRPEVDDYHFNIYHPIDGWF